MFEVFFLLFILINSLPMDFTFVIFSLSWQNGMVTASFLADAWFPLSVLLWIGCNTMGGGVFLLNVSFCLILFVQESLCQTIHLFVNAHINQTDHSIWLRKTVQIVGTEKWNCCFVLEMLVKLLGSRARVCILDDFNFRFLALWGWQLDRCYGTKLAIEVLFIHNCIAVNELRMAGESTKQNTR